MIPPTVHRFQALDALRGLCALMVVLFHLPISSHVQPWALTRNGYLFVDFFFVLSGFVIAHAYGGRIGSGAQAGWFMIRRLGRVWPLHVAVLAVFLAIEILRVLHPFDRITPFRLDREPEALITNLLLIQAWGMHERLTWNGVAWSISVEIAAYIAFAAMTLLAPRRFMLLAGLLAVVGAGVVVLFSPNGMNTTWDYAVWRGLYGFFLGVLVHRLWTWRAAPRWPGLEAGCLGAALMFVIFARGDWAVAAPLVFALCVWVFAGEGGRIAGALRALPFQWLGTWSYSIYMTHILVITVLLILARKVPDMMQGPRIDFGSVWVNDLFAVAMIAFICGLSALTYRFIETPGRDGVNRWVKARQGRSDPTR